MVAALDENFGVYRCPHSVVFSKYGTEDSVYDRMGTDRFFAANLLVIFQAGIMHLANSTGRDAALSARSRDALHKCIGWLDQIGTAYACSPQVSILATNYQLRGQSVISERIIALQYRSVLAQLETMGNKELRDHQQVTEILASRIASRAQSPVNGQPRVACAFRVPYNLAFG